MESNANNDNNLNSLVSLGLAQESESFLNRAIDSITRKKSNQTIITFATSGGTEIEKADNDLCEACKNHGRWVKGKRFNEIEMDVINVMSWVDSLGL